MTYDLKIENVSVAMMTTVRPRQSQRGREAVTGSGNPFGLIRDAAVLTSGGKIAWVGKRAEAPVEPVAENFDGSGGLLTPGLIDCHTHLIYGGNRASEFEERLNGASYEEILKRGGGILSTVRATREASVDELTESGARRLTCLTSEGVTTVEIKTGYGLNPSTEDKMIRVMKELEKRSGITIKKTFLGAHAIPPEYAKNGDGYVDLICRDMIPAFAQAVDFVDVFCESVAFTPAQTERVFEAARRNGLGIKIHAEQLSNMGGAALAARYNAASADHLEYIDEAGVKAMAERGTAAVLLPGAFYFLKKSQAPPVRLFRNYGVPMAIATDSNPGSSPCLSLLLMLNMACTLFGLTPEEALLGVTRNAAKALGIESGAGSLEPGKTADMALFDVKTPTELIYSFGGNPCVNSWKGGKVSAKRR